MWRGNSECVWSGKGECVRVCGVKEVSVEWRRKCRVCGVEEVSVRVCGVEEVSVEYVEWKR